MTVKELIMELQEWPEDARVTISGRHRANSHYYTDMEDVVDVIPLPDGKLKISEVLLVYPYGSEEDNL